MSDDSEILVFVIGMFFGSLVMIGVIILVNPVEYAFKLSAEQMCESNGYVLNDYKLSDDSDKVFDYINCKNETRQKIYDNLVFVVGNGE